MLQGYSCGEKDALKPLSVDGIKQKSQWDTPRYRNAAEQQQEGEAGLVAKRKWLKSSLLYDFCMALYHRFLWAPCSLIYPEYTGWDLGKMREDG